MESLSTKNLLRAVFMFPLTKSLKEQRERLSNLSDKYEVIDVDDSNEAGQVLGMESAGILFCSDMKKILRCLQKYEKLFSDSKYRIILSLPKRISEKELAHLNNRGVQDVLIEPITEKALTTKTDFYFQMISKLREAVAIKNKEEEGHFKHKKYDKFWQDLDKAAEKIKFMPIIGKVKDGKENIEKKEKSVLLSHNLDLYNNSIDDFFKIMIEKNGEILKNIESKRNGLDLYSNNNFDDLLQGTIKNINRNTIDGMYKSDEDVSINDEHKNITDEIEKNSKKSINFEQEEDRQRNLNHINNVLDMELHQRKSHLSSVDNLLLDKESGEIQNGDSNLKTAEDSNKNLKKDKIDTHQVAKINFKDEKNTSLDTQIIPTISEPDVYEKKTESQQKSHLDLSQDNPKPVPQSHPLESHDQSVLSEGLREEIKENEHGKTRTDHLQKNETGINQTQDTVSKYEKTKLVNLVDKNNLTNLEQPQTFINEFSKNKKEDSKKLTEVKKEEEKSPLGFAISEIDKVVFDEAPQNIVHANLHALDIGVILLQRLSTSEQKIEEQNYIFPIIANKIFERFQGLISFYVVDSKGSPTLLHSSHTERSEFYSSLKLPPIETHVTQSLSQWIQYRYSTLNDNTLRSDTIELLYPFKEGAKLLGFAVVHCYKTLKKVEDVSRLEMLIEFTRGYFLRFHNIGAQAKSGSQKSSNEAGNEEAKIPWYQKYIKQFENWLNKKSNNISEKKEENIKNTKLKKNEKSLSRGKKVDIKKGAA